MRILKNPLTRARGYEFLIPVDCVANPAYFFRKFIGIFYYFVTILDINIFQNATVTAIIDLANSEDTLVNFEPLVEADVEFRCLKGSDNPVRI